MSEKERFQISCAEAANYPKNLVYHDTYDHILKGYIDRLDEQAERLFFDESKASLSVRDYDADLNGTCRSLRTYSENLIFTLLIDYIVFENITLCSDESVQDYFNGGQLQGREDPQCRLMLALFNCVLFGHVFREFAEGDKYSFVYAPHSRERLRTTRQMLMFVLTYHQVIPSFLDFLFPFGRQLYAQDSQFSGFRHEERLSVDERGSTLPELGRSGRDFRICYNLKSVEPSKGQKHWPWSTRQTAVYHSFDIETGKSICVIVKGDQLIKKRMEAATKPGVTSTRKPFSSLTASFSSCLAVHLVIFDWSREHWRWFINFLEEELQKSTRQTLLVDLDRGPGRAAMSSIQGPVQRITSSQICTSPTSISEKSSWRSNSLMKGLPSYSSQPKKLAPLSPPAITSSFGESQESLNSGDDFSFSDLQRVQDLEEKTNGTLLVLESNINILSEVKQYYESIIGSEDFPKTIKLACARDITKFTRTTDGIINDLRMQSSRTKMLLRLLTDRKSLVSSESLYLLFRHPDLE
jgi:hypothetical protein